MEIKDKFLLYEKTVKRLERMGISNPIAQIIQLAEEIEWYRERISDLTEIINRLQSGPTVEE